jgi:hypothetical protein
MRAGRAPTAVSGQDAIVRPKGRLSMAHPVTASILMGSRRHAPDGLGDRHALCRGQAKASDQGGDGGHQGQALHGTVSGWIREREPPVSGQLPPH